MESALTSELLSCKGRSIFPGKAPSYLARDLGPRRSPARWAGRAGKLGGAGTPGRWLEVEFSTQHPRPSGCRSLEAPPACFSLELPSALTLSAVSPGEVRPGAQKSCEQRLSEHPPSRAGTAQPPGHLPTPPALQHCTSASQRPSHSLPTSCELLRGGGINIIPIFQMHKLRFRWNARTALSQNGQQVAKLEIWSFQPKSLTTRSSGWPKWTVCLVHLPVQQTLIERQLYLWPWNSC